MHINLCSWYRLLICLYDKQTNKQMKMSEKFLIKIVESFGDVMNLLYERKKNLDFYTMCEL